MCRQRRGASEAGFSIPELLVAMVVTLSLMAITSTLLGKSFGMRTRENTRTEAIADVQRALNIMARELANSGYSLPADLTYAPPTGRTAVPRNGLLPAYSDGDSVAFVSNLTLDAQGRPNTHTFERDESVLFRLYNDAATDQSFLVRKDLFTNEVLVLANRVDNLQITYYDPDASGIPVARAANSAPTANTVKLRIVVTVNLPAVGRPGSVGFQPAHRTELQTEVALRNANLGLY